MGHNSSYTKAELREQPNGCGKPVEMSHKKCGWRGPDMEAWLCLDCQEQFSENLKKLHEHQDK